MGVAPPFGVRCAGLARRKVDRGVLMETPGRLQRRKREDLGIALIDANTEKLPKKQ
jgi:hypothetical protein